jgi:DNA-3-methyladenine glycosylase II
MPEHASSPEESMSVSQTPPTDLYRKAQRHLARRDPVLKGLIAAVGPCTLRPDPAAFLVLVRAILAQMISTKAAASIFARVQAVLGPAGFTPAAVLAAGEQALRGAGLSGSKARALLDLAVRVANGSLPLDRLPEMPDDEVIARLLPVRGIGTWTAQMFLIFSLGRTDVLAVDDFGLRAGVRECYGLSALPDRAGLCQRAEAWRPYRSVATWYFWKSRGFVPQSG